MHGEWRKRSSVPLYTRARSVGRRGACDKFAARMAHRATASSGGSRGALFAWALAALCVLPREALAQTAPTADAGVAPDREARAASAFSEAMEAWRRSDCIAASTGFARAMELVPHPDTRYNLARALECAPDVPGAIAEYTRFLAESADADDRREVEARLANLRQRPGQVFLTSDPLDAAVTVDAGERPAGRTPCHLALSPGAHVIVIERAGFERTVQRVVVDPGASQDLTVSLVARAAAVTPPVVAPPPDRVLARRSGRLFSGRAGLVTGFSVPLDRPVFVVGLEAGVFFRRSLSAQAHAMWIDVLGAPFLVGGDLGWVFVLDEVDLGLYLSGSALFQCDTACREGTLRRDAAQFIGGVAVRADVALHPRLAVGLFGRAAWRNFDLTEAEGLLASGGLSLSLFL